MLFFLVLVLGSHFLGDSRLVLEVKKLKSQSSIILGGLKNHRGNRIQASPSFGPMVYSLQTLLPPK